MSFVSYAQNFEDVMLWRALKHIENGFYVDIGAQDPIVDSVSLAFYEHGWRGVHVEPTQQYSEMLRMARPDETVLQVEIGNQTGMETFYEFPDTGFSTADSSIAMIYRDAGFNCIETSVPVVSMDMLFERIGVRDVHWLKLDVEGLEKAVLESWKGCSILPWVLVVESTRPMTQEESHGEWEHLLLDKGYRYLYFDGLNRFYVSPMHLDLAKAFKSPPNVFDGFTLSGSASQTSYKLMEAKAQQAEAKAQQAEAKAQQAEAKAQQAEALLHNMRSSTFWRLTGPLRWWAGGVKSLVKRGLRRSYRALAGSPWLLDLLKRFLSRFPRLERVVRRGISTGLVDPINQDEELLTDLELKALMDIKDAIANSRESVS